MFRKSRISLVIVVTSVLGGGVVGFAIGEKMCEKNFESIFLTARITDIRQRMLLLEDLQRKQFDRAAQIQLHFLEADLDSTATYQNSKNLDAETRLLLQRARQAVDVGLYGKSSQ